MVLPIVAIGASAGGLEAVSELLAALPPKNEMAYVVIQHLDPEHKSLLAELLARKTAMPVEQIHDGLDVQANHVYVIPPNTALTLSEDRFHLSPRVSEGPHHPVDVFFSSLADTRGEAAIGVVLSGGDGDGTLGVQAIKHGGGITFAQEPSSAKFPSMPHNAIETGCVDFVLRPSAIAQELKRLGSHPYLRRIQDRPVEAEEVGTEEKEFKRVFRRLRSVHGVDFAHYKRSTLRRRLGRRMAVRKIEALSDYLSVLEEEPAEAAALYQDFLIRVTSFFRDPESFEILSSNVFPRVCEGRSPKEPVRIWIPGCASGEEVYSIAIALVEYLGDRLSSVGIQIFGTDVSDGEIEKARAGLYVDNIVEEVSAERLKRFFVKQDHHYRIAKNIRDLCIFARQDVTRDPPFSRLDLVSCRNLLIYLDATAQRRVMQVFHYSLRPQGFLLLGPSESVGSAADLFETLDKQQRLYSRKPMAPSTALELGQRGVAPGGYQAAANESEAPFAEIDSAQREADRLLLAHYSPASLLVDEEFNILQFRGETGPYIEHASGPPSLNLHRVVRPELLVEISPAIAEARETGSAVRREGLSIDDLTEVVLKVIPLKASSLHHCYLILFEDSTHRPSRRRAQQLPGSTLPESEKDRRLVQLQRDLAATRDYLQSTAEEHEAVKEELKSAHEEVLSANEEFQSTNEELETAKEEMQAANEELITTNDELRNRNRELSVLNVELQKAEARSERARAYADSIVRTVRDALVVLDSHLKILRANMAYYTRFNTRPEETEGCLLERAGRGQWKNVELLERLGAVLTSDAVLENYEIQYSDPATGLRTLRLNACKVPGDEERAELILLAIEDVTQEKASIDAMRGSEERFRAAVEAVGGIVWTSNARGEMEGEQPGWAALTGQTMEEYQGFGWTQALHPEDAQPTVDAWKETLAKKDTFVFEHRVRRHDGEWRKFAIRAVPVLDEGGVARRWVGVHTDVTDLRALEEERISLLDAERAARSETERANQVKDEFLATLSHELRTPLSITLGWSRILLKKHGAVNDELTKGLKIIINSTTAQAQIISDLLDISSIMSGKTMLNLQPLDLNEFIAQCVAAHQVGAAEKEIALTLEQSNEPKVVLADTGRLQQVVGNLLTNAFKFTPSGGRVNVQIDRVGNVYEISVQDNGEGIAPDFLPQLFGRFRQADGSIARNHGGLGLGLAIVKRLIDMHGGSVRAESAGPGQGARFTVSVPLQASAHELLSENALAESGRWKVNAKAYDADSLKGVRALVVEDDASMLEFIVRILEEHGAQTLGVRTAAAALETLSALSASPFGVLISDIGLSGTDGYELVRRVREVLHLPADRLAAIAVTAFGREGDRQRALKSGFQAHLAKPFEASQLVAMAVQLGRKN